VHYAQTVRGHHIRSTKEENAASVQVATRTLWTNSQGCCVSPRKRMPRVCAGIPVHYEQTVRGRVARPGRRMRRVRKGITMQRYTMCIQSGYERPGPAGHARWYTWSHSSRMGSTTSWRISSKLGLPSCRARYTYNASPRQCPRVVTCALSARPPQLVPPRDSMRRTRTQPSHLRWVKLRGAGSLLGTRCAFS